MKFTKTIQYARLAAMLLVPATVFMSSLGAVPITYTLVIPPGALSSGKLGAVSFSGNVVLTFTFNGDTANVVPFTVMTTTHGYENVYGTASVKVADATTGTVLAHGTFLPSAGIFVSIDNTNGGGGVGFGSAGVLPTSPSFPGQPVYPYAIFSAGGLTLETYDLKSTFTSGQGVGLSCVDFPQNPQNHVPCGTPIALPTNNGDLYINPALPSPTNLYCCGTFSAQTQPVIPFSMFTASVKLSGAALVTFQVNGAFTLGTGSPGIHPVTDTVTLQIDSFSLVVPPGSFKHSGGSFVFTGIINGVTLNMSITPAGANHYTFVADGSGANFTPTTPVSVVLTIGANSGKTIATML